MRVNYINVNGQLQVDSKPALLPDNRSFRYGDGLFETMRWTKGTIRLLPYHTERLQQGLQTLQMTDWSRFDIEFLHRAAADLIARNDWGGVDCRFRLQVYRGGAGLYSPVSNQAEFVLSGEPLLSETNNHTPHTGLTIDLFTEQFKTSSGLSMLKSTNSLLFVLAGLYRKRKGLDEVIILNQDGLVCESMSSNVFVVYEGKIYTPALSEGCVAGVMRRKILELASGMGVDIIEARIDPQILTEAEEVFLTNAVRGVQWVMGYREKRYFKHWTKIFQKCLADQ